MAEAIAVGASIIAFVQIAERVIELCKSYIEIARDAPSDLSAILVETSTVKIILENLNFLISHNHATSTMIASLSDPIKECEDVITKLNDLIPSVGHQSCGPSRSKRQKIQGALTTLAWPLKQEKARKHLQKLVQHKTTINLALTTDSIHDLKDIKSKTNKVHDILTDNEKREVYTWVQSTDPSSLHHRAYKQYEHGTCDWVLRLPEFVRWLEGHRSCLWFHGIPGAGKTILIAHLIEYVSKYCESLDKPRVVEVYYYCYHGHNQDEAVPFLRWTISRLCRESQYVPQRLRRLYRRGGQPSLEDLLSVLEDILTEFDTVYIMLDAVDESFPREDLLRVLRDLATDMRFHKIQLLVTSREYVDIENILKTVSSSISMSNAFVEHDIKVYVRSELSRNSKFKHWSTLLIDEIVEALGSKAKGMFRWAKCQVDVIQHLKPEINVVRQALLDLPETLDETYERIFLKIPERCRLFVHYALKWIYFHRMIYRWDIGTKLLLQVTARSVQQISGRTRDYYHDEQDLRDVCGCLITIKSGYILQYERNGDVEGRFNVNTVSFAHYTVLEFLSSDRIGHNSVAFYKMSKEPLIAEFTAFVFRQVLQNHENWINHVNWHLLKDLKSLGRTDLQFWCCMTAVCMTKPFKAEIIKDGNLRELCFSLFNPLGPHYPGFVSSLQLVGSEVERFFPRWKRFWRIEWSKPLILPGAANLFNLLLIFKGVSLIPFFEEKLDTKQLVHTSLTINADALSERYSGDIQGSVLQILAFLGATDVSTLFGWINLCGEHASLNTVFAARCAGHLIHGCDLLDCGSESMFLGIIGRVCDLIELLDGGADCEAEELRASPLQITIACRDIYGTKTLLKKGANPNYSGNSEVASWPKGHMLSEFDRLSGMSPLQICRNIRKSTIGPDFKLQKIESLLLRYGALELEGTAGTDPGSTSAQKSARIR